MSAVRAEVRVAGGVARDTSVAITLGAVRKDSRWDSREIGPARQIGECYFREKVLVVIRVKQLVVPTEEQELMLKRSGDR